MSTYFRLTPKVALTEARNNKPKTADQNIHTKIPISSMVMICKLKFLGNLKIYI